MSDRDPLQQPRPHDTAHAAAAAAAAAASCRRCRVARGPNSRRRTSCGRPCRQPVTAAAAVAPQASGLPRSLRLHDDQEQGRRGWDVRGKRAAQQASARAARRSQALPAKSTPRAHRSREARCLRARRLALPLGRPRRGDGRRLYPGALLLVLAKSIARVCPARAHRAEVRRVSVGASCAHAPPTRRA